MNPIAALTSDPKSYNLNISFKRAYSLPVADILSFSSDPYLIATLRFPNSNFPKLHYRTRTLRRTLEPEWNEMWSVANVPATGAILKLKVMDEDHGNHDDTLGVAHIEIESGKLPTGMDEEWVRNLSMRKGGDTWIAIMRIVTVGCGQGQWRGLGGVAEARIQAEADDNTENATRAYIIGPHWWSQHFSPLIGIITHTTSSAASNSSNHSGGGRVEHYSFTATKLQLRGPLPSELDHRYFAFRPVIKTFYTKSGIRGRVLNRALKHQYRSIYSYNKNTQFGIVEPENLAKRFLEMTNWGEGGKLYTYVITLDSEWRFTETGSEFSIQWLSKHTMHSCVSINVGFAGEFFVRATKHHAREGHVHDYELVIDNDSGTYRPPNEHLEALRGFLQRNLEGLKVTVADCVDNNHQEAKKDHVKEKDRSGRRRFKQPSNSRSSSSDSSGSISSSDEEELRGDRGGFKRRIKNRAWGMVAGDDKKVRAGGAGGSVAKVEGKGKDQQQLE